MSEECPLAATSENLKSHWTYSRETGQVILDHFHLDGNRVYQDPGYYFRFPDHRLTT